MEGAAGKDPNGSEESEDGFAATVFAGEGTCTTGESPDGVFSDDFVHGSDVSLFECGEEAPRERCVGMLAHC